MRIQLAGRVAVNCRMRPLLPNEVKQNVRVAPHKLIELPGFLEGGALVRQPLFVLPQPWKRKTWKECTFYISSNDDSPVMEATG